ncbi:helix-turn-helix domain-containing protein [Neorhizobium galegae]|uniref:helix-turn-helix domain-containing protein n=1 Tax=Neorhizobium galegae TaxID=399 RepID=UPI001F370FE2|nr:helix-turn-helix domain-containing protein [Neorhizobium galegae]UIK05029.1 helix-turn-helix domain-containing protein [Neorhizobium galegae]
MSKRNWKTTFQAGIYTCPELRTHKIHRDLLAFLTFKAHQALRVCWPSQTEIAEVLACSVRNVHDLLVYLEELGAIFPVRLGDLPNKHLATIKSLTPNKATANAKAYFLCEEWAHRVLQAGSENLPEQMTDISILEIDREKGRKKANERRRRYAPDLAAPDPRVPSSSAHDEWQFLNAIPSSSGSSTSAPEIARTGSPTTDMTIDNNPAAISAPNNDRALAAFAHPPSKAEQAESLISSLPVHHGERLPHGYGAGAASACDPRPQALARPEGTEYDAARACEPDRRAS